MSPELEQAVKERITLGHTKEQIAAELEAAGYTHDAIEAIYASVSNENQAAFAHQQALPRNRDLFATAWNFMTSRLDLVGWIALPPVLIGVLEYLNTTTQLTVSLPATALYAIVTIALVIFSLVVQIAVIYTAVKYSSGEQVTIQAGFNWAVSNFFGWLWLVILSALVILGGWFLLIVPGIIASVYIVFSQYVFVDEGSRGMAALQRSRQLVYGRFGSVLWRLFVMMLFLIALYIPVAIFTGIVFAATSENVTLLIATLVEGLVSGFVGVFAVYYLTTLYQSLKTMPTAAVAPTNWYTVFAGFGVVFFLVIIGLVVLFAAMFPNLGETMQLDGIEDATPTQFQLEQAALDAEMQAELEAFQQQYQAEFESN